MNSTQEDLMQQWILHSPGQISLETVLKPTPNEGDLLIRVLAATTCGTDLKAYLRGHPQIPMPGGFGHEWCGVVEKAGTGAKYSAGDEVCGVHTAPCFHCRWCLRGQENLCETIMQTKVMGSFATHLLVPKRIADVNVFRLPLGFPPEVGCLIEPLACVMEGYSQLKPDREDEIAIIGPGAIGLLFAVALQKFGHHNVVIYGRTQERLRLAESMGIRSAHSKDLVPGQYDAVIECTGTLDVWQSSLNYVRKGGTVVLFGGLPSGTQAQFDAGLLHYSQIKILSPFHFGSQPVKMAWDLLQSYPDSFRPLISAKVGMQDLPEALQKLQNRNGIKYALIP